MAMSTQKRSNHRKDNIMNRLAAAVRAAEDALAGYGEQAAANCRRSYSTGDNSRR